MVTAVTLFLLSLAVVPLHNAEASAANPIRKVVTMLQEMQVKIGEEGKKEQALFDKFMCYCKTAGGDLEASIKTGKAEILSLEELLKSGKEQMEQLEADLKEHEASRAEAKEAMAKATALREKEAAAFAKFAADLKTNLAALAKAIPAIETGMGGAFLQTEAANSLKRYTMEKAEMPDETRQEVLAFLSGREEYAPQSGQIVGILKQMADEMTQALEEAEAAEAEAIKAYDALMAAKEKEVETLNAQIEAKLTRKGDLGVELAGGLNELEDTKTSLAEDEKFLAELETGCATKEKEWAEVCKTRQEELVALTETIKILNDDDALELFKKTLPSAASLLQVTESTKALRQRALMAIREAASKRVHLQAQPQLDLIALALNGKTQGFDKVIGMIDDMVGNLKKEQADDEAKKEYCDKEFDTSEDKKKELDLKVSDSATAIEELEGSIAALAEEIAALVAGIKALDKAVAEATEIRKSENADYKELKQSDTAAKEILAMAKNRLNKFYNPKLYTPPPVEEPTFVQISAHSSNQGAPPPPPETFGPYSKKTEESTGVIAMVDLLVADLEKELQEAAVMEEDAQKEYEEMMAESATKRADDSKAVSDKTALKASEEEALMKEQEAKGATEKELMTTLEYIHALHGECDWLLKFFDARTEARTGEIEALGKAKAVLSGADYSLLQTDRRALLRGFGKK
jgi:chromosome segregation ATPase